MALFAKNFLRLFGGSDEQNQMIDDDNGILNGEDVSSSFCPMTQSEIKEHFGDNMQLEDVTTTSTQHQLLQQQPTQLPTEAYSIDYWLPSHASLLAQVYKQTFNIQTLYEWQVQCFHSISNEPSNKNLIYCAPTSGGKTLVAEVLMARRLLEVQSNKTGSGKLKKVMFIAPFISIVEEKTDEFITKFGETSLGFQCRAYHSNVGGPISSVDFEEVHICVCTIEKANSMINQLIECGRLDEICMLVIDEVHMIMDVNRGYLLEILLTKVMYMNIDCQIVGMSATLPNVSDLADWINASLYVSEYRPVPLKEYIKLGDQIFSSDSLNETKEERTLQKRDIPDFIQSLLRLMRRKTDDHVPLLCHEVISDGGQVLVFCSSKVECVNWAKLISLSLQYEVTPKVLQDRSYLLNDLSRTPSGIDKDLASMIMKGVAFHHAGITTDERKLIEDGFRNNAINVLCCTTTLSAGVNLPCRRCIFIGMRLGIENIDIVQYKQSCGRAGRAGLDTYGESIIILSVSESMQQALHLMHSPFPELRSCLSTNPDCLNRALLEVIASGVVSNAEDIQFFLQNTLLSRQISKAKLSDLVNKRVQYLTDHKMVTISTINNQYRETRFGRGCFLSCLPPQESEIIYRELEDALDGIILRTDIHPIYFCTPLRHNLPVTASSYIKHLSRLDKRVLSVLGINHSGYLLNLQYSSTINPFKKDVLKMDKTMLRHYRFYGAVVLSDLADEASITEVAEKYGIPTGLLQQLQKSASTYACMITTMCYALGWSNLAAIFSTIAARLQYGVKADIIEISSIPGLSAKRARKLHEKGLDSIGKIASAQTNHVASCFQELIPYPQSDQVAEYQLKMQIEERNAEKVINSARKIIQSGMVVANDNLVNFTIGRTSQQSSPHSPPRFTQQRVAYASPKKKQLLFSTTKEVCQSTSNANSTTLTSETRQFKRIPPPDHKNKSVTTSAATPEKQRTSNLKRRVTVLDETVSSKVSDTKDTSPAPKRTRIDPPDTSPAKTSTSSSNTTTNKSNTILVSHKYNAKFAIIVLRAETNELVLQSKLDIVNLFKKLSEQESFGFMVHSHDSKPPVSKKDLFQVKRISKIDGISFSFPTVIDNIESIGAVHYLKLGYPIHPALLEVLKKFFASRQERRMYSFCIKEQWRILYENGITISSGRFIDVQIADWILKPDEKKGRDSLDVLYRNHLSDMNLTPDQNGLDLYKQDIIDTCISTVQSLRLGIYLRTAMRDSNLLTPFEKLEMRLIPVLSMMEYNGFAFETDCLKQLQELIIQRKDAMYSEMERILKSKNIRKSIFSPKKDVSSPKKVGELLFTHLKLENPTKTKSTKKEVLCKLMRDYSNDTDIHTILSHIKEIRNLSSLLTKQVSPLMSQHVLYNTVDGTRRIYAAQLQIASETGRLATINPNLQNIPHETKVIHPETQQTVLVNVRKGFTVSDPENFVLLSADYRQIECRMMAHLADDKILINIMNEGKRDLFDEIACEFFGHQSVDSVTSEERDTVKTVFYGIMYGMGPHRLGETLKAMREDAGIERQIAQDPTDEAKQYIDTLMNRFPSIRHYTRKVVPDMLEQHGCVYTLSGRRRHLEESKSKDVDDQAAARRKALSTICQGSAADLIKVCDSF
jgi:DNA polymerase theta